MFNARRGGLSVAVLYWRVEKTQRRTLELAAGLGHAGPRFDALSLSCPAARLSSPAQVGHASKLSRFAVEYCGIFAAFPVTRVPAHRRAPIPPRVSAHTLTVITAESDFRLASSSSANRLVTHPHLAAFPGNLWRQQCSLHSVEASCSGQVWSREHPLAMARN